MWGWLRELMRGLVSAVLDWWQKKVDEPDEIEDVKTPDAVRERGERAAREWMRNKKRGEGD